MVFRLFVCFVFVVCLFFVIAFLPFIDFAKAQKRRIDKIKLCRQFVSLFVATQKAPYQNTYKRNVCIHLPNKFAQYCFFVSPNLLLRTCNNLCSIFKTRIRKKKPTLTSNITQCHCQAFVVSRAFMAGAASQAGDADSSRAPGLTSGLQGSMDVHRGALLLVPQ